MSFLEDSIQNMSVATNASVDTYTNYYVIQKDIVIMIKKICYFGIIPILILSGLILNALCCVMFYKLKNKTSTVVILVSLAVTDIFILLTAVVYVIKIVSTYVGVPLTANQMIQILPYFDGFMAAVPNRIGNILTFILSAERLFCVLKPMKIKHYIMRKTAIISVLMTYAMTLVVSLPQGFYFRAVKMYSNDTGTMVYILKPTTLGQFVDFTDYYNIVLTCIFKFVPVFSVMLISTIPGIVVIISGKRRFKITEGMSKAITSKEMHVTKTLLTITFTFTI
ncbi:HRH2 [Mytilus coruscus]|uniref:HRH2 n=1 Tax=Mytilus coruscus TaxID=42192 RepID=A0A6J7ZXI8_MYTCO|nr:HRH2 [Mytilus coruscus]